METKRPPHRIAVRALLAVGGILIVLAIFSVWAERQVLNTDEWVETSSELLEDEEIQAALNSYLIEELFANVDVAATLEERLPPQARPLSSPIAGALRQFATEVGARALAAPRAQDAWAQANRGAHEALVNLIEGDGELVETTGDAVTLDLADLLAELAARVGVSADIVERLPDDIAQLEIMQADQIEAAQTVAAAIRGLALLFSLLGLGCLGLAIYLARGRRRSTVLWAGWTLIAAGVVVFALRNIAGDAIVDALVKVESAEPAAESTWSISTSLMVSIARTVIVFGILFVVAAWLGSPRPSATFARRALAPYLERHPAWAYGLVVAAAVVWFALAPTHGLRALLTICLLAGLGLAGVAALRRQAAEEFPDAEPIALGPSIRGWTRRPAAARGAAEAPVAPADARLDQLERLARLREAGVLSDDELAAEKARILAGV